MNIVTAIRSLFSRPYPAPESFREDMKGVVIAAMIVTAILYVFRPFGMSYYEGNVFGISLLFGSVSLIAGFVYTFFLRYVVKTTSYDAQYTIGKWIAELVGMILIISIGNWLVLIWMNQGVFNMSSFFLSLTATFLIGIFPIVIFGLQNQVKQERRNAATALDLVTQLSRKEEKTTVVKDDMILAIQAMENYINVYSLSGEEVQKEAIRRTLKSAQEDDDYQSLIKSHRSYLVNPAAVKEVNGNAQGLKLHLGHDDCPVIPVSRSYIPKVKELLS